MNVTYLTLVLVMNKMQNACKLFLYSANTQCDIKFQQKRNTSQIVW